MNELRRSNMMKKENVEPRVNMAHSASHQQFDRTYMSEYAGLDLS